MHLFFINGIYAEKLSSTKRLPDGVVVKDMATALRDKEYKSIIQEYLLHTTGIEKDPFVLLNTAFARHGVFIQIPANKVIKKPIHLLYITDVPTEESIMIYPKSLVIANKNSQLTLLESYHAASEEEGVYWTNTVNQIVVQTNACVKHYKLQNEGKNGFQINNTRVYQAKDSTYCSFAADFGGQLIRNNLTTYLKASGTNTQLYGIYMANNGQHIDNQTFVDHAHPHSNSNELYKGILTGRAKGVFNGKIIVRQDAQKTKAYQQNSSLVLSKTARMYSKPQLEIFADDVKCSHGATIGQLEEEAVFYLRTRGLTDSQARSLLIGSFLKKVIDSIDIEPIVKTIERLVLKKS